MTRVAYEGNIPHSLLAFLLHFTLTAALGSAAGGIASCPRMVLLQLVFMAGLARVSRLNWVGLTGASESVDSTEDTVTGPPMNHQGSEIACMLCLRPPDIYGGCAKRSPLTRQLTRQDLVQSFSDCQKPRCTLIFFITAVLPSRGCGFAADIWGTCTQQPVFW